MDFNDLTASEAEMQQEALSFLKDVQEELRGYDDIEEADVRLQIFPDGGWDFHSGDACYDVDHSGYWGASSVSVTDSEMDLIQVARDLVEDALDSAAQALC